MKPYHTLQILCVGQQLKTMHLLSSDPFVNFLSRGHLLYAVPASIVLVLIGMLLPLVLILYPTRCGTWLGGRLQSGRLRNAVRTFVEAMNGSYKDGSSGTRDYRAVPGLMLLLRSFIASWISFRGDRIFEQSLAFLSIAFLLMALAGVFAVLKPYKTTRHNLCDTLLYCLLAVQCIFMFGILSHPLYERSMNHIVAVLCFSPFLSVVLILLKPLVIKIFVYLFQSFCMLNRLSTLY